MAVDTMLLKQRLDAAISARSNVDGTWDEVEKWVGPLSGGQRVTSLGQGEGAVRFQRSEIWDSSAPDGADKLAAHLSSSITNSAVRWARLTWQSKKLQANEWIEQCGDRIFAELQASDFYSEIGSFYGDWVRYGTACFIAEAKADALTAEQWKGLDFSAPPIRETYYEPDYEGNVLRYWRFLSWTPAAIISKFGEDKVPQRIKDQAANPQQGSTKLKVVYCIFVRPERAGEKKQAPLAPNVRPVGYCYFIHETAELLGEEGGFYEMPAFIVPWDQAAGSDWGHGPGIRCLPDVRYLNKRLEQLRMAAEKAIDPSLLADERHVIGDVNLEPGGVTVSRSPDALKVIESGTRFDVAYQEIADMRAQVRARFWTDELTLKLSPQMTATEVNARLDMMQKLFGPTLSRLQAKALNPLLQLVFAMLYRAKRLPPMPPLVRTEVERAGGEFDIDYQGPLSRAQRIDEVAAIERLASAAAGLIKLGFQDVAMTFDPDAALREMAKRLGTPAGILRSEDEVKAQKAENAKLQREAMRAEVARAQGEAMAQQAEAAGAVQSQPATPVPLVSPVAGGGLM